MFTFLSSCRVQSRSLLGQRFARPLLLLLCFTLSALSSMADAFEIKVGRATYWCDDDGTAIMLSYENHERLKSITIPTTITANEKTYRVTGIGERTFYRWKNLTSVSFPAGLKTIEREAFCGCSGLTSVSLPDGLTTIGKGAFIGCSGLISISLPAGLTTIGASAFIGCSGLTSISLPAGLTEIGEYAFSRCSGLTSISLPDGLTTIGRGAFYECSGLTSVSFPDGLTSIGESAFRGCSGLTSVSLPDGLKAIGNSAFYECSGLTSISLPDGLTTIESFAFYLCSGLTSVSFPDGLTTIGESAFDGCSGLTSVSFPSGLTLIKDNAFYDCSNLSTLSLEGWVAPAINDPGFYNAKLNEIHVPIDATYDTFAGKPVIKDLPIHTKIFDPSATYDRDSRIAAPITYKRRFTDTEWQPLYVPFALTTAMVGKDIQIAVLNDQQLEDGIMRFHHLRDDETLPAWSIALIRAKTVGKHVIALANAPLAAAEERILSAGNYLFFGNLTKRAFHQDKTIYLLEKGDCRILTDKEKIRIFDTSELRRLGALRWYMTPTATVPDTVRILVDGVPSAIEGIHVDDTTAPCYDLGGRRLEAAPEHGVYIQSGRKKIR